jgi:predicted nucleotidyltransferase component of viral defense system
MFVLKGGLFLFSMREFKGRPTRDIDLLAQQISNDMEKIKKVFEEICNIEYLDGVIFDIASLTVERIRKDAKYEGVRIEVDAYLGKAVETLQIDIGFGEVVIPKPVYLEYPSLLSMENPKIKAYSFESVVSEKFEAMVSLSLFNSRLKDFYDIYTLLCERSFDGRILQEAIFETFQNRGTLTEKEILAFEDIFVKDEERNRQWKLFLKRIGREYVEFEVVVKDIKRFLLPVYEAIIKEDEFFMYWKSLKKDWVKKPLK